MKEACLMAPVILNTVPFSKFCDHKPPPLYRSRIELGSNVELFGGFFLSLCVSTNYCEVASY